MDTIIHRYRLRDPLINYDTSKEGCVIEEKTLAPIL